MCSVLARVGTALTLPVLAFALFADCAAIKRSDVIADVFAEAGAIVRDPGAQWMVIVWAGTYLVTFILLRRARVRPGGSWTRSDAPFPGDVCLAGLILLMGIAYALHYAEAAQSTQAVTLLGTTVLGQGAAVWESRKQKAESTNGGGGTVLALIVLLGAAAVWQTEMGHVLQYHGQARWSGPWDNPNVFGVLMGVGVVLAAGRLVQSPRSKVYSLKSWGREHRTLKLGPWLRRGFFLAAAGVMGVGWVKSYSRGAWVGAALGLAYLGYFVAKAESRKQKAEMGRGKVETLKAEVLKAVRSWLVLAIISVAVGLLAFWSCRHTEWAVARRAYTLANANDFSWRNRVAAYEGALQMLADKPWFGFGWNQPEGVYEHYYRAAKVDEGMAIQLNDYFTLGTTLGIPALACFAMYIGLSLSPKSRVQSPKSGSDSLKSKVQSLRSEAESPKSQKESSVGAVQGPVEAGQMPEDGAAGAAAAAGPTLDFRLWTLDPPPSAEPARWCCWWGFGSMAAYSSWRRPRRSGYCSNSVGQTIKMRRAQKAHNSAR